MEKISVVISAYNEEKKLPRTLKSVQWVDEIIVIDSASQDKTSQIASDFGAKIYHQPNHKMLNINKNFGFSKATKDWILCLDADEVISFELKKEIINVLKSGELDINGYWIPRKNIIFGKWIQYGIWWPDRQLRLFRKGKGRFPLTHVHEYIEVEGQINQLTNPYIHYNYESISQYISKMDTIYTINEVKNLEASGYKIAWYDAIKFPISDFLKLYFAQRAYKDGLHGLILSLLQAFYSFIVFAKLWEHKQFPDITITTYDFIKQSNKQKKEIDYWLETANIENAKSIVDAYIHRLLRVLKKY